MIHQPSGQVGGQVSDIEIQAAEILKERERLNEIVRVLGLERSELPDEWVLALRGSVAPPERA
jgi:hypothetical protein